MRPRSVLLRLGVATVFGAVGLAAISAGSAGAAGPGTSSVLSGTAAPPAALGTPTVGSVPPAASIQFDVALNLRDAAGADALVREVSTPGSAQYRQYLTPAQWEARFSPTAAQVSAVTSWLSQEGFAVGTVSPDRLRVAVTGTAAQVEQAFSTSLSYHVVDHRTVRLVDTSLSVPSSIAALVAGAPGLNQDVATPAATWSTATASSGAPASTPSSTPTTPGTTAAPAQGGGPSPYPPPPGFKPAPPCGKYYNQKYDTKVPPYDSYPYPLPYETCGYLPGQFRSAYGVAAQVTAGQSGQGETVAIVDAYASPTLLSDVQTYDETADPTHPLSSSQFSTLYPSSYDEPTLCTASGWYTEQTIDVTAVHAMAPGAHILYAASPNCLNTLTDTVGTVVDGHLANVVTDSWGYTGGDLLLGPATRLPMQDILLMADGTGVSVLFSSGDDGDNFPVLGVTAPDYPASSPYDTAVGGTTLQIGASGQRIGELGWSTYHSYLCTKVLFGTLGCTKTTKDTWLPLLFDGGAGGGTSYNYAQPWYQTGIVPSSMSHENAPVVGPTPMRVVPDFAMDADPSTGLRIGQTQTFPNGVYWATSRWGGTSVASPLLAGVVALADQAAGASLGFLNPALYKLDTTHPSAIYDVVPGGKQGEERVTYANRFDATTGLLYSTRIITYEGTETYCNGATNCATRKNTLVTQPGYDNMTGLGTPGKNFVSALAKL